ncbi:unnamed protein product [Polarella glacialis]|uniref:Uncharacterized protein n=1 Tax=Polarella glacialis TaxID=89957 RepID=A0A813FP83_POLGL|nr:unnamed protein product [Polarella glacialis]
MKLQQPELPMTWLAGTKFCVFGLGDSTYSQFCYSAACFDTRLGELGGRRLLQRGVGDDRDEDRFYTGWENWLPELWMALGVPQLPTQRDVSAPCYREEGYDRDIRHYEFQVKGTPISYKTGDSLAVWPRNPADKAEEFCCMMGVDAGQQLRVVPLEGARNWCPLEVSVRQLFTHVLDIFGKPNRKFFDTLSRFASDEFERAELMNIVERVPDGEAVYRDLLQDYAHMADVLKRFKSARPPLEHLINMVPALKPRSYSIASSSSMHPDTIQLCVVMVDWIVGSTNERRIGEATGFLSIQEPGAQILCTVRQSAIVLPKDPTTPIIMAGTGTGLAPWRAVTQERVHQARQGLEVGPCLLLFGARYSKEYLYRDEFNQYVSEGVLRIFTAFSRDQVRNIYVQHRLVEASTEIADLMLRQNGHFFVCGSARRVPEDIYLAMKEVVMKSEKCNEDEAEAALSNLKMEGRYTVEAWS